MNKEELLQSEFDKHDFKLKNSTPVQFCYAPIYKAMDAYHVEQSKPLVDCLQEIVNKIEDLSLHFKFNSNIKKAKEAIKQFRQQ